MNRLTKKFPRFPDRVGTREGFTLVELLVSMSVLAVLVLLVAQLTNSATSTVSTSGRHIDADTEARMVLNRVGDELSSMLKRTEIDFSGFKQPGATFPAQYGGTTQPSNLQAGNDQLVFYSQTSGSFITTAPPSGSQKSPMSLIAYAVGNDTSASGNVPVLRRMVVRYAPTAE